MMALILSCRQGESVLIGDNIRITAAGHSAAHIAIDAPRSIAIVRESKPAPAEAPEPEPANRPEHFVEEAGGAELLRQFDIDPHCRECRRELRIVSRGNKPKNARLVNGELCCPRCARFVRLYRRGERRVTA